MVAGSSCAKQALFTEDCAEGWSQIDCISSVAPVQRATEKHGDAAAGQTRTQWFPNWAARADCLPPGHAGSSRCARGMGMALCNLQSHSSGGKLGTTFSQGQGSEMAEVGGLSASCLDEKGDAMTAAQIAASGAAASSLPPPTAVYFLDEPRFAGLVQRRLLAAKVKRVAVVLVLSCRSVWLWPEEIEAFGAALRSILHERMPFNDPSIPGADSFSQSQMDLSSTPPFSLDPEDAFFAVLATDTAHAASVWSSNQNTMHWPSTAQIYARVLASRALGVEKSGLDLFAFVDAPKRNTVE